MLRKVMVPKPISAKIGGFGLSRPLSVRLLTRIHEDIANDYEKRKGMRSAHDDRLYMQTMVLSDSSERHLFRFAIDDTTAPDHLIIADIAHTLRPS